MEQALAIRDLQKSGLDVRACAKEVGTSPGQVVKRLRLLNLHPELLEQVRTGRIGPAKAYTLSRLPRKDQLRLGRGKKAPTGDQIDRAVRRRVLSREVMAAVTAPNLALMACPRCGGAGQVAKKPLMNKNSGSAGRNGYANSPKPNANEKQSSASPTSAAAGTAK